VSSGRGEAASTIGRSTASSLIIAAAPNGAAMQQKIDELVKRIRNENRAGEEFLDDPQLPWESTSKQ
jgi:hypothetical protein